MESSEIPQNVEILSVLNPEHLEAHPALVVLHQAAHEFYEQVVKYHSDPILDTIFFTTEPFQSIIAPYGVEDIEELKDIRVDGESLYDILVGKMTAENWATYNMQLTKSLCIFACVFVAYYIRKMNPELETDVLMSVECPLPVSRKMFEPEEFKKYALKHFRDEHVVTKVFDRASGNYYIYSPANWGVTNKAMSGLNPKYGSQELVRTENVFASNDPKALLDSVKQLEGGVWGGKVTYPEYMWPQYVNPETLEVSTDLI